jgi:hypothetical protein
MEMSKVYDATMHLCGVLRANYYKNSSPLDYDFVIEPGNKYLKIVMVSNGRSVHAFVDKSNGDLYKAASWRAPAKGVRFNVLLDMKTLEDVADWAGSYLYRR